MVRPDEGGGGGGTGLDIDYDALGRTATALTTASTDLDAIGRSTPGTGDTGDAGALLAMMISRFTDTGARLAVESSVLADLVTECTKTAGDADRAAAEAYLLTGKAS